MDCGSPPVPHSTKIIDIQYKDEIRERYGEYSFVRYECDSNDKELIGEPFLKCLNGRWNGKPPKCAMKTKSISTKFITTNNPNKHRFTRVLRPSIEECYKTSYIWNITYSQNVLFEIESNSRIDFFSLIIFSKQFVNDWKNGDLMVRASMDTPHKQCDIQMIEKIGRKSDKTKILFKCYKILEDLRGYNPLISDSIKTISIDFNSKNFILVKYCSLNTYSSSEFCGLPERPLHSIELIKEKSFIVFSCEQDFYLEPFNSQKVMCGSLGEWDKPFPRCVAKSYCRLPALNITDHFIKVEYKDLNYLNVTPFAETKSVAIYSCSGNKSEIELIGVHQRVCNKGFWSGFQPKCMNTTVIFNNNSENRRKSIEYREVLNSTKSDSNSKVNKIHLVIVSMIASFIIGAIFIGVIAFIIMKGITRRRDRISKSETIPSLILSEPNHYYERNTYEECRYESLRLNALELLDLERINSLYQTSN